MTEPQKLTRTEACVELLRRRGIPEKPENVRGKLFRPEDIKTDEPIFVVREWENSYFVEMGYPTKAGEAEDHTWLYEYELKLWNPFEDRDAAADLAGWLKGQKVDLRESFQRHFAEIVSDASDTRFVRFFDALLALPEQITLAVCRTFVINVE